MCILKQESIYAIMDRSFPLWYILSVVYGESRCMPEPFKSFKIFFMTFIPSVVSFLFHYFTQIYLFLFPSFKLLNCRRAFFTPLIVEFSFLIVEGFLLFVLFDPALVYFESPFFHHYLVIYRLKSHCQTYPVFCFGLFIAINSCVFFLSIFSNCFIFFN